MFYEIKDVETIKTEFQTLKTFKRFIFNVSVCVWCVCCRRRGDVVIVEMQSPDGNQLKGCVVAVLRPPGLSSLG